MTKYEDLPRDEEGDIIAREVEFPIQLQLASPITADGRTVKGLVVREPTVGDIEVANHEKNGLARMIRMVTLVAELSPDEARRMGSRDYVTLQGLLENFL